MNLCNRRSTLTFTFPISDNFAGWENVLGERPQVFLMYVMSTITAGNPIKMLFGNTKESY